MTGFVRDACKAGSKASQHAQSRAMFPKRKVDKKTGGNRRDYASPSSSGCSKRKLAASSSFLSHAK